MNVGVKMTLTMKRKDSGPRKVLYVFQGHLRKKRSQIRDTKGGGVDIKCICFNILRRTPVGFAKVCYDNYNLKRRVFFLYIVRASLKN